MGRVISVWLPSWQTDRLRRRHGTRLAERPCAVVAKDRARRVVAGACDVARQAGVLPGMTAAQAQALAPDLVIVPANPEAEENDLARLTGWCLRYSPVVSTDDQDGILIDITGHHDSHGEEEALLADLIGALDDEGFHARAAIADTIGVAWAVVRYGSAKLRAQIVPVNGGAAAIGDFPVGALRLPPGAEALLEKAGIQRIRQLSKMSRKTITGRFGGQALHMLDRALGREMEPVAPLLPDEVPCARLAFVEPAATAEELDEALTPLVQALCENLRQQRMVAKRVDMIAYGADRRFRSVRIENDCAGDDPSHLRLLLSDRIDKIDPRGGIEAITLAATLSEICQGEGDARTPPKASVISIANRLAGRAGAYSIPRAPVRELRGHAISAEVGAPVVPAGAPMRQLPLPSPLVVLSPPEPVQVLAPLPESAPALFVWRGNRHRVARAEGPDPIIENWFRTGATGQSEREYFRVEDDRGQRYCLYRQETAASSGIYRWFLHGLEGRRV